MSTTEHDAALQIDAPDVAGRFLVFVGASGSVRCRPDLDTLLAPSHPRPDSPPARGTAGGSDWPAALADVR